MAEPPEFRRKLYGRRKGPALSAHQQHLLETLLPQLAPRLETGRNPKAYFSAAVDEAWLEIGFGGGEHLLWQAQHHPNIGIIGAEPYISGVAKLLSRLAPPSVSLRSPPPQAAGGPDEGRGSGNLCLYSEDARDIISALPDASLGRVFILFPDPWPKTRHHKRRFIQMEMLDQLARVMKPGAELRFATDDRSYLVWALERLVAHPAFAWLADCPADWRARSQDWPETRYEAKAKRVGRASTYLRFVRR